MDRRKKYTLSVLCLLAAVMSATAIVTAKQTDERPVIGFALCGAPGERIVFDREDFENRASGELSGIIIDSLPESGILVCSGEELRAGSLVSVSSIGAMYYRPADDAEGAASFSFTPVFQKGGAAEASATVTLNMTDRDNTPPIAKNASYETYADMPLSGRLTAYDPDGDTVAYEIIRRPQFGQIKLEGDSFTYTPTGERNKTDSFSFAAVDALGGVSGEATVSLSVKRRDEATALTYSDMADSPAHYAAVRLAEKGVMRGESIGTVGFLYPDRTVSRAEFVTMISTLYDMPLPTAAVVTGMGDNDDIPQWAKPSVAAALSCQLMTGEENRSGNRVFRASDPITRAEAAVVVDRMLDLKDDNREPDYADASSLPRWAKSSIVNAVSAGYLDLDAEGSFKPNAPITREEAAACLYKVMETAETSDSFWDILN